MKLRHEHITIILAGLVCLLLVEVVLLRSALQNEIVARREMDQLHSHYQAVHTAKIININLEYAELAGRFGKVERDAKATMVVFREIGLIPVPIGKAKRLHKKAGGG